MYEDQTRDDLTEQTSPTRGTKAIQQHQFHTRNRNKFDFLRRHKSAVTTSVPIKLPLSVQVIVVQQKKRGCDSSVHCVMYHVVLCIGRIRIALND